MYKDMETPVKTHKVSRGLYKVDDFYDIDFGNS